MPRGAFLPPGREGGASAIQEDGVRNRAHPWGRPGGAINVETGFAEVLPSRTARTRGRTTMTRNLDLVNSCNRWGQRGSSRVDTCSVEIDDDDDDDDAVAQAASVRMRFRPPLGSAENGWEGEGRGHVKAACHLFIARHAMQHKYLCCVRHRAASYRIKVCTLRSAILRCCMSMLPDESLQGTGRCTFFCPIAEVSRYPLLSCLALPGHCPSGSLLNAQRKNRKSDEKSPSPS